ncbi:MAG: type II secretion system F family protein [Nitrososphaerota archaeon]|nr:type II secretion system F family protein [Nitrososphaerota archaeon]
MKQSRSKLGFWGASYVLYAPYVKRFERFFKDTKKDLAMSGLRVTFHAYVAGALFISTIAGVSGALAGFTWAFYAGMRLDYVLLLPVSSGVLAFAGCFTAFYFFPSTRAHSRGRKLDTELPYAAGHMSVLSTAGVTPERIFEVLAREEEGGVIAQESSLIVRDMATMGMDLSQAIDAEIKRSPSDTFSEFLDGFRSASLTGSDLNAYLQRAAGTMMLNKRLQARAVGENVGVVAEIYTIVLVVAPLLLLIMFSVMGAIVGTIAGLDVLTLMYLIAYLFVPVGGLVSLIMADQTVRKEVE